MEIVQNKRSNKHIFTFEEDHFNFAYKDSSGSGDTDIKYVDLPPKASIQIEQNEWLRNVGYLWCLLGFIQLGYAAYSQISLSGKGFWLILGLICILWARLSKITYSVYQATPASVFVIHGRNHDKIISELNSRRKAQFLDWYSDVNPKNDLEQEVNKFRWLVDQKIITKEESETKIAEAEFLFKQMSDVPSKPLN